MDTLTFSIGYITIGALVVFVVWVFTAPKHTQFLSLQVRLTTAIQIAVNALHFASGLWFPLAFPLDIPVRSLGLTIFTVGVVFAVWAKFAMGTNWGLPGVHKIAHQDTLVTEGPFSYSRNPIYTGLILMSLGIGVALKSAFIFIVFILYIYFLKKIQEEEKQLEVHFGKEYEAYTQKVGRFI